ncbi:hypothetical protein ACFL5O_08740 [Myxococcota bacterium]
MLDADKTKEIEKIARGELYSAARGSPASALSEEVDRRTTLGAIERSCGVRGPGCACRHRRVGLALDDDVRCGTMRSSYLREYLQSGKRSDCTLELSALWVGRGQ